MFVTSPIKSWRRQKEVKNILNKVGSVISFTKISVAGPEFKSQSPYPVVLVQFENGEKSFGQLVDYKQVEIKVGMKVISTLRKNGESDEEGIVNYGMKFKSIS